MAPVALHPTTCAYCGTLGNATEIYPANFDDQAFSPGVFSARRLPDRVHYRLVRCKTCGLLRSDPIAAPELLNHLYAQSDENYAPELSNIRLSYGRYLSQLDRFGAQKGRLLEIGCGSGFFLEEAQLHGYADVRGLEPGAAAVARATPNLRDKIRCDILRPGLFPQDTLDVICMFQVFDHLPDPNASLQECFKLLKAGGHVLALNHDAGSLSARLLGEGSPIIDIEHTYLYDRRTMAAIFRKHGFEVLAAGGAVNHYSLQYLSQLMPLPAAVKVGILAALRKTKMGRLGLTVALGNLFLIARKPSAA
jgi:SAM-dependent methyltransferase